MAPSRMPRRTVVLLAAVPMVAGLLVGTQVATAPPAAAATGDFKVTFVARSCPPDSDPGKNNYKFIRANRARNNIMETLKDLGPDTNYTSTMTPPVNPVNEAAAPQNACGPVTNWAFTTGDRISGKAPAPLDYLSKVGNVNGTYRTLASTPELDQHGQPTGRTLAGAVTVPLTDAQAALAGQNKLWVMGGTPTDPLGEVANGFGPGEYAFGALRCAVDALNGDNVETAAFRNGSTHVFCYALYVTPPEPNGQIIVRKAVTGGAAGGELFGFGGNISYNPGGTFSLKAGERFDERRSTGTWFVTEDSLPAGWTLDGIDCGATTGAGTSAVVDLPNRRVDITLGASGVADCTYTNRAPVPTVDLEVAKVTNGGVGSFDFDVPGAGQATLTTTQEGVEVAHLFPTLTAGTYTMTETLPTSPSGTWSVTSVECYDQNGASVPSTPVSTTSYSVTLATLNVRCLWTNAFAPTATLVIRAKTYGGTDPAINYLTLGYDEVTGDCDPAVALYDQNANTTGDPSGTSWHTAVGDSTAGVPVHTWCIAGTRPTQGADPSWVTRDITCTGDIDTSAPFNTSPDFTAAIVRSLPGGTVTCDFTYVKRGTVDVSKLVSSGNASRTGPVTVSLTCDASEVDDPGAWPKVLTLAPGASSATLSAQVGGPIYVDGDPTGADTCHAVETANGAAPAPGQATLTARWNGAVWPASATKSLGYLGTASVAGTASNGKPVAISVTSGACSYSGGLVRARATHGTCTVGFKAAGNPGATVTTTTWTATSGQEPVGSGTGATTSNEPVAAGGSLAFAITDAYAQAGTTITTSRAVQMTKGTQQPGCPLASSVKPRGTTVLVTCDSTNAGASIGWSASCRATGLAPRGDVVTCRVRVGKDGRVTVTTYGYPVAVMLTGRARATTRYAAWVHTYRWFT